MKEVIRLTESDLHNIIKHSVNNILKEYGYVPHDGNSMVGGRYDSWKQIGYGNIIDNLLDEVEAAGVDEGAYMEFESYVYDNQDSFDIKAIARVSYDESTGYGSRNMPIFEIEEIIGLDNARAVIEKYPSNDGNIKQIALNALNTIDNNLSEDDFDFDNDMEQ